jgi:Holliday junction resolvase RusA-like endonuclease
MEFVLEYNEDEYLIILNDFLKKDKAEVFRLSYSDSKGDCIEYEIQVFVRKKDEWLKIRVVELSEVLKSAIAEIIQKEFDRIFIANPYFDELLIFYKNEVFTSQDKYKAINCNECSRANLYEKGSKDNKTEYIDRIKKLMEIESNTDWPFKEKLMLQFSVSGTQSRLDKIDLDNLAKTIFDIFKGVIYEDDSQIVSFAGSKDFVMNLKAFIVAIKRLESNEKPVIQEYLFSGKMNSWQEERKQKQLLNKATYFRIY